MNSHNPLQRVYEKHLGHLGVVTPLEKTVCAFIKKNPPAPSVLDILTKTDSGEKRTLKDLDPWHYLSRWREKLAISLIVNLQETAPQYLEAVKDSGIDAIPYPFWDEFQLPAALRALNCHLSDLPIPVLSPIQLESGAAPLESGGHWTWAEIPHTALHAELGALWSLLGHVTNNAELTSAAIRLAEWHLKTLDFHFHPFTGLFVQEEDASLCTLLTNNYLLFHAVAVLTKHPEMEYVAQRQLEYLEKLLLRGRTRLLPLAPMLEEWIGRLGEKVQPAGFTLPSGICDPSTALIGYRSPSHSVVCTLFGGKTGLGCLHADDIQIINYGPQRLPLNDCQGFGIEGGVYSNDQSLQIAVDESSSDFSMRRQARVTGVPVYKRSAPLFRNSAFSGIWIDVEQRLHQGVLNIETSFLGMTETDQLAFTFFVKAKQCTVNGQIVNSRSLARYQGASHPITLHGSKGALTIDLSQHAGELQVIPLAGEDSFWSADFLLAYKIEAGQPKYKWTIEQAREQIR
jgi:hypothetical protein